MMKLDVRHILQGDAFSKPSQVLLTLRRKRAAYGGLPLPSLRQVQYFVTKVRKEVHGRVNDVDMAREFVLQRDIRCARTRAFAFGLIDGDGSDRFPCQLGTK